MLSNQLEGRLVGALRIRGKDEENEFGVWSDKSDVFSFGILAFELLYGRFERPNFHINKELHESLVKKLEESSTVLSDLSKTSVLSARKSRRLDT